MSTDSVKQQLEGRFQDVKGRIKESWGSLTDDDLDRTEGKWDQLVGTIKDKTGETRGQIEEKLQKILN